MNATETVHIPLGASELPQVSPVIRNGAVTAGALNVIAVVLDLFLSVMVFGVLWRVAITSPKLTVVGEIPSLGALVFESVSSDCAIAGRANSASIIISVNAR